MLAACSAGRGALEEARFSLRLKMRRNLLFLSFPFKKKKSYLSRLALNSRSLPPAPASSHPAQPLHYRCSSPCQLIMPAHSPRFQLSSGKESKLCIQLPFVKTDRDSLQQCLGVYCSPSHFAEKGAETWGRLSDFHDLLAGQKTRNSGDSPSWWHEGPRCSRVPRWLCVFCFLFPFPASSFQNKARASQIRPQ